jgi:hypothetical protein
VGLRGFRWAESGRKQQLKRSKRMVQEKENRLMGAKDVFLGFQRKRTMMVWEKGMFFCRGFHGSEVGFDQFVLFFICGMYIALELQRE